MPSCQRGGDEQRKISRKKLTSPLVMLKLSVHPKAYHRLSGWLTATVPLQVTEPTIRPPRIQCVRDPIRGWLPPNSRPSSSDLHTLEHHSLLMLDKQHNLPRINKRSDLDAIADRAVLEAYCVGYGLPLGAPTTQLATLRKRVAKHIGLPNL
jgi:hypothetical protein